MAETSGTDLPEVSYDAVPYESLAFFETHPDRLATLARLHGLDPAPVATARVLELGCAGGGNLVPMALAAPKGRFVGVDRSARQIEAARALAGRLGLTNIEFHAIGLEDLGRDAGPFDYVICHGLLSWLPPDLRAVCLEVIARSLAVGGVGLVSYNALPGWRGLGVIREFMAYHAGQGPDPVERVQRARQGLDTLLAGMPDPKTPFAQMLAREIPPLRGKADSYLLHDHMEEHNQAYYFHEFLAMARRAGLDYLTDARFHLTVEGQTDAIAHALDALAGPDRLRREQYLDFLRNRTFRRSLVVAAGSPVREPRASDLDDLRALAVGRPDSDGPDVFSPASIGFHALDNRDRRWAVTGAFAKAALVELAAAHPRSVPVPELRARALARLSNTPAGAATGAVADPSPDAIGQVLLSSYRTNTVDLVSWEPEFAVGPSSARPTASPLALIQLEDGAKRVTSLRHRVTSLTDFERLVLRQCDGRRERPEVLDHLVAAALDGTFPLNQNGQPITDVFQVRAILDRSLDPALQRLRDAALMVG
jgi:SAM-dependent methyltransferase